MATIPAEGLKWDALYDHVKYVVFVKFTWRHGEHVGVAEQLNDGHVGVIDPGNLALLLLKNVSRVCETINRVFLHMWLPAMRDR